MKTASSSTEERQKSPPSGEGPNRRRERRRRWIPATSAVVVVGAGVAVAVWAIGDSPAKPDVMGSGGHVALGSVTRQTLEQHTEVDGKLAYAGGYDVVSLGRGVITRLPRVGTVVDSGDVLYRVAGKPIIFLRGDRTPAYRALSQGMHGSDVRQLNAALVDLGHDDSAGPSATSSYFGQATEDAVERLQDAVGARETGELPLGTVVFLPADKLRITERRGVYGAPTSSGQKVLKATSTTPMVSIAMDASEAVGVKAGDHVTVSLPNGKDTSGVVRSVGKVATTTAGGSTVPVDVRLSEPRATGGLEAAAVKVTITSGQVQNVLAVPVTALLAMGGGGYSVEVADTSGAHRLVRVKTGLFDDAAGLVEVSGPGLTAGQRIVLPAT